jgi:exodeoxyribonuclease V alpha subunit
MPKRTRAVIDALYRKGAIIRKGVYGSPIVRDAEQVEAIRMALVAPLLIVSGGPGTGKTSLLVNILRALVRTGTDPTRIVLAAPTGRAAQGMSETLAKDLASVAEPDSGDLQLGRLKGSTLHKLLVYRSRSGDFYYGERCFIPADVIVVDEVSMVDVVMMDRLFQAIHPVRTRVILIGDKNQLPSVEAGSVLADLSSFSGSGFVNHFVELRNVYRSTGQLLDLAQAINFGHPVALKPMDFDRALNLEAGQWAFVTVQGKDALNRQLDRWVVHQYIQSSNRDACSYVDLLQQSSRQTVSPAFFEGNHQTDLLDKLFAFTRQCRILTVLRHGFTGARWVNDRISNRLRQILDPESSPDDRLFNGALIIITRNDYTRDLFNGDVGLVLGRSDGLYQAYFKRASEYVAFPASNLTDWDLAFAMTVHKSQGSEFDDALLVLPEDPTHRLLTREIIYTAVTRASQRLMVCGTKAAFQTALERKLERQSGLMV